MRTAKGKVVRADFQLVRADAQARDARVGAAARGHAVRARARAPRPAPDAALQSDGEATSVTIELRQTLSGFFPRFGGFMVRRAAAATLDEALDGLERVSG